MRCYYEELSVGRDATDADIKTAYRKLALRWHPDKNPDKLEEAKERFQLIQQAYEVLSDPHERAWYDNHREQILRGKNSNYEDNCLDVFQYFTVSCFKGYGDDAKSFYSVYREVFEKIVAEDAEFLDDEEEVAKIPGFGSSDSSYEEVVGPFYAYWQSYCTKKTYTWLCPYDIQEIKDRRILREIEKETKKIVQKAKKERNEEVRNLVSFVRKRDRRVHAYRKQLEERAELNRQKQQQNRLEQIRKRQREIAEASRNHNPAFQDAYEEQLKQLEQEYDSDLSTEEEEDEDIYNGNAEDDSAGSQEDIAAEDVESDDEEYVDDLYCVACNKSFKTPKAFGNHQESKKHKDNVERIKQEMLKEEEDYKGKQNDSPSSDNKEEEVEAQAAALTLTDDEQEVQKPKKKNKKSKKAKKGNSATQAKLDDEEASDAEDATTIDDFLNKAKAQDESDEDWPNEGRKSHKKNKNKKQHKKESTKSSSPPTAVPTAKAEFKVEESAVAATPLPKCVTCGAVFPSKNKLFAHLKLTNHGVYIPKAKDAKMASDANSKKRS